MRCVAVRKQLNRYLDAELAPKAEQEIRLHLSACPACRQALRQLEEIGAVWAEIKTPAVPEGFAERLMQTARGRSVSTARPASPWMWLRWWWEQPLAMRAAAGSAVCAGLVIGLTMGTALFQTPTNPLAWSPANHSDAVARTFDFLGGVPAGSVEQTYLDWVTQASRK